MLNKRDGALKNILYIIVINKEFENRPHHFR
jgi:hypothetical protein